MKEFITYLVQNLVDAPDKVDIELHENDGESLTMVKIRVSPEDIAKLIGKGGRTINSLRTIALTVGARFKRRVRIEVVD